MQEKAYWKRKWSRCNNSCSTSILASHYLIIPSHLVCVCAIQAAALVKNPKSITITIHHVEKVLHNKPNPIQCKRLQSVYPIPAPKINPTTSPPPKSPQQPRLTQKHNRASKTNHTQHSRRDEQRLEKMRRPHTRAPTNTHTIQSITRDTQC